MTTPQRRREKRGKLAVTKAFAAIGNFDPAHVPSWTIAGCADTVRIIVGKSYNRGDHEAGWQEAYKDGFRVRKIVIREVRP